MNGGVNTYAYVGGNPIMFVDPTGELACGGVCVAAVVVGVTAIANWTRNYWNEPVSSMQDVRDWNELPPEKAIYHRMTRGNEENRKFVSPDGGHSEAVFDANGCLVTDPMNMGTYNYFGPDFLGGVPHGIADVLPYMIFGTTPSNMFTTERFTTTWEYLF